MTDLVYFSETNGLTIHIISSKLFQKLRQLYPSLIDQRIPDRITIKTHFRSLKIVVWEK